MDQADLVQEVTKKVVPIMLEHDTITDQTTAIEPEDLREKVARLAAEYGLDDFEFHKLVGKTIDALTGNEAMSIAKRLEGQIAAGKKFVPVSEQPTTESQFPEGPVPEEEEPPHVKAMRAGRAAAKTTTA